MSLADYAGLFAHLVSAIVCAAVALILWDIGTRPPGRALADITAARKAREPFGPGLLRFAAGAVFLAVSTALLYFAVPDAIFRWFTAFEIATLLSALMVELLIGDDVRAALGLRRGTGIH